MESCLNRNLIISAIHIPGKLNVLADHKSRNFQRFHRMDAQSKDFQGSGSQAWPTRHRPICIESEPPDTGVRIMATRAKCGGDLSFNLTLNFHLSYLFSPFSLIPLCFKKIQRDQAEFIFIALAWKSRPWYLILLSMLLHQPLLLPSPDFLFNSQERTRFTPSVPKGLSHWLYGKFQAKSSRSRISSGGV